MQLIHLISIGVLTLAAAAPIGSSASQEVAEEAGQEIGQEMLVDELVDEWAVVDDVGQEEMTEALPASLTQLITFEAAPPEQVRLADTAAPSEVVSLEMLDEARGGTDTVSNEANLNGLVSNNSAININTGANIINGAAFSDAAGIPMVIQNSGANVLIQNATIVNLQLR